MISQTIEKSGQPFYVSLDVDKPLIPNTFTYPAMWTGSINSSECQIRQTGYDNFVEIVYPAAARIIYNDVCDLIEAQVRLMN